MGSILFRNRIRCREKSLSKRCIIRVENRYLPGNCDPPPTPSHSDDRMTGIRHSSEPGRLLVNIFLLFFFFSFSPLFPLFLFPPSLHLAARFTRVRSNDKQNETLCMPKTAISGIRMRPFPGGYGNTKKIEREEVERLLRRVWETVLTGGKDFEI